jgi:hypothetical protein
MAAGNDTTLLESVIPSVDGILRMTRRSGRPMELGIDDQPNLVLSGNGSGGDVPDMQRHIEVRETCR